ncbi:hypothetical protein LINPERHAP2_LOCUS4621, partial [Linum perenne]
STLIGLLSELSWSALEPLPDPPPTTCTTELKPGASVPPIGEADALPDRAPFTVPTIEVPCPASPAPSGVSQGL